MSEDSQISPKAPPSEDDAMQHAKAEKWLTEQRKENKIILSQSRAAVSVLRDGAKWIIGGVAIAAGGVIAGSTLTSLGSLGLEWRLLVAICGAAVGFVGLLRLLASATDLLEPRTYDWRAILLRGETISACDRSRILGKVQAEMPSWLPPLQQVAEALAKPPNALPLDRGREEMVHTKRTVFSGALENAVARIAFEHNRTMFQALKRRLFVWTPFIAIGFGIFAWAANPPKDHPCVSSNPPARLLSHP